MFKLVIPAFAALSLAASAQAKELDTATVSVVVPYADLDLTSEAGAATLDARIIAAAKNVCGRPEVRGFTSGLSVQDCRRKAIQDAKQQVASLHVTTLQVASAR